MKVRALTRLIQEITCLLDSGKYDHITIEDVHAAIKQRRVLRFLKEQAGKDLDISVLLNSDAYGNFEEYNENQLNDIYGGYAGQERRKWGIENLGLCLVLVWTTEIIQQQGKDLEL
jgi:hypothetical protein